MAHVKKIKVAMNLDGFPIPEKIEKSRSIVTEMTGNTNFGAPGNPINPPLADVTTGTDELETAHVAAKTGGKTETATQHEKETALDNLLTQLGHYVEDVANNNPATAESVVLSAGMDVKKEAAPVGDLPAPQNLRADFGDEEGEIELDSDTVKGAGAYVWNVSADPIGPDTWEMMGDFESVSTASKFTWEDLTPGDKYHFRGAAVGAAGRGAWSDVATRRAP